ncbi:hypothetical protein EVAR_91529_1 [Eumeta japonica]|uniref:Uncharacterized protein n=1 Tax=Eumeta variegata TaxID=151549 RepID=A0A4C1VA65_EUMVA|nr:hypothetical protein EVAR_91529_1 [Eumeta japonica]
MTRQFSNKPSWLLARRSGRRAGRARAPRGTARYDIALIHRVTAKFEQEREPSRARPDRYGKLRNRSAGAGRGRLLFAMPDDYFEVPMEGVSKDEHVVRSAQLVRPSRRPYVAAAVWRPRGALLSGAVQALVPTASGTSTHLAHGRYCLVKAVVKVVRGSLPASSGGRGAASSATTAGSLRLLRDNEKLKDVRFNVEPRAALGAMSSWCELKPSERCAGGGGGGGGAAGGGRRAERGASLGGRLRAATAHRALVSSRRHTDVTLRHDASAAPRAAGPRTARPAARAARPPPLPPTGAARGAVVTFRNLRLALARAPPFASGARAIVTCKKNDVEIPEKNGNFVTSSINVQGRKKTRTGIGTEPTVKPESTSITAP